MNELPERLPSRPLRNWFLAWHIHTGDPADVIAKGFDLDPVLVGDLLAGEVPLMISAAEAIEVCRRISSDPVCFWGRYASPLVGDVIVREASDDLPESLLRALGVERGLDRS